MKNNKLKLIITLLILTSMLLASCVPTSTTSTTDNSSTSEIESSGESFAESFPEESTPFSEPENSDVDTSEESIAETSDISTSEESDLYPDIVVEPSYEPFDKYTPYYVKKVGDNSVVARVVGSDAMKKFYDEGGPRANPEYYYKELQLPDTYLCIKGTGITKEEFEKSNTECITILGIDRVFTQEEIDVLFSCDDELVKKYFKTKDVFYYKGRLYTIHEVMSEILMCGGGGSNANHYRIYRSYNENGELLEYLQYMERALESGKYDGKYNFRAYDIYGVFGEATKEMFFKDIYLQLIRFGIKVLTNTLYE